MNSSLKDRILFFIDNWFVNFGMARSLQKKYDSDLFAIIDFDDKAKQFFQKQKLVKFQKIWNYTDFVSKSSKKPDIEYLKSIEKKYRINLWGIAFTDRDFYQYNHFYKFQDNEILSLLEQACRFFEQVLDEIKPDFISMILPTAHYHQLLYEICRARGIKILMLTPVRFANRMMISENVNKVDNLDNLTNIEKNRTENELQDYLKRFDAFKQIEDMKKSSFESNMWKRYKSILKFFISVRDVNYKNRYSNYGKTRLKVLNVKMLHFLKKKYRNYFINHYLIRKIDDSVPFVYYPLHFEPERVTLIDAFFYTNQLAVITNIAKSLPVGYTLFVKEHPAMKILGWRSVSYYKQIMNIPNVKLIHPSIPSEEIMRKSSLVITIAGTSGQEAAFFKKPAIVFTDQLYSSIPSVCRLQKIEDLPQSIKESLQTKVDSSDLNKFVEFMDKNTFELNLINLSADFAYRFGFKGPMMDADLPEVKVESFLNDYDSIFELLALQNISKIKSHKENESKQS